MTRILIVYLSNYVLEPISDQSVFIYYQTQYGYRVPYKNIPAVDKNG